MAPSDNESEVSKDTIAPISVTTSSMTSSKPAKHMRNGAIQRPMIPLKFYQERPSQAAVSRASGIHSSLDMISTSAIEKSDTTHAMDDEEESEEDSTAVDRLNQISASESSVPQALGTPSKRSRAKTSHIHEYISTEGDYFVCSHCSRKYKSSGGTGAISRHLKKAHSIDPTASSIAKKRIREGTGIDAAILRGAEMNIKAEEKRREQLMSIGLDKTTLEYLYLQWTISQDIPLKQVRNSAFRTFLEYVNPVANRMLPDSESTMKIHAENLLDGKVLKSLDDKEEG